MLVLKAYRFRLDPTPAQRALFSQTAGAVRFVWNWGLAQRKALWAAVKDLSPDDRREHRITAIDQINQLPALKAQFPFLREVPSHCLQQVLRNLDQAFARFCAGACRHPRFRRKGERASFRFPDAKQFSVGERAIALPKAGDVRYRNSRPVVGRPKQTTFSWDGAHWQVSVLAELETSPAAPPTGPAIGIDLGVAQSITCSDGAVVQLPVPNDGEMAKAARLQRRVSRRRKGSRRRSKAQQQFNRFRRRLVQRRSDAMHKVTTRLAKSHGFLAVEFLSVRNMTASAAGTIEYPGRQVRQKAGLNRAILAQAFAEFRRQLTYKAAWSGARLVAVSPRSTSQRCSRCGHTAADNRPSQAVFCCVACGHSDNADHNAAVNILAAGIAAAAQGRRVSGPMNWESWSFRAGRFNHAGDRGQASSRPPGLISNDHRGGRERPEESAQL
jgi:putative transposase